MFREGARRVLEHLDAEFVEADSTDALFEHVAADPDFELVLLDLQMPGRDGWEAFQALRDDHPELPVVIVSSSEEPADVLRALDGGAAGFVPKSSSREVLQAAFDLILAGGVYVPPLVLGAATPAGPPANEAKARRKERAAGLTPRQLEVLTLMSKGLTNKEIAQVLEIAEGTVKAHIGALFEALDVTNRTEASLVMRELDLEITNGSDRAS